MSTVEPVLAIVESPHAVYLRHAAAGELAYQVSSSGAAVFFPRLFEPGTGDGALEWRISAGRGTVYATTTVRRRGEAPHNVSMIDLDEGFRLMSAVVDSEVDRIRIGQRVRVDFRELGEGAPLPVFLIDENDGDALAPEAEEAQR